jgi:RNA polymerase sigma-70 factor (ECF subfamily)
MVVALLELDQQIKSIDSSHKILKQYQQETKLESFSDIYSRFFGKIYRYIFYRVSDEKTAEDLTSQVFMKAWENIDDYEPADAQLLTWLFTIAHNTIIDYYRTRKETVALDGSLTVPSDGLTPEEASETDFENEWLHQAIQKLTDEQKHVVVMKYMQGLTTEEIALQLGKKTGTVRALQMRALQSLSKYMLETR